MIYLCFVNQSNMKINTHIDNRCTGRRNKPECKNYYQDGDLLAAKAHGKNAHGEVQRAFNGRDLAPDKAMSIAAAYTETSKAYARKLERRNKRK